MLKKLDRDGDLFAITKSRASGIISTSLQLEIANEMLRDCKELENALENYIKGIK